MQEAPPEALALAQTLVTQIDLILPVDVLRADVFLGSTWIRYQDQEEYYKSPE
jgi:hypothetical protein